jgi:aconitate hydratase
MGRNISYKILEAHLVSGTLEAGNEIGIRIDQTLTQDATGTMAFLQFEAMGLNRVQNELAVSYIDHNTVQIGFENADDHRYLQSAAARFGAVFSKPGNGICHQLHVERFGIPGKTLLGSDSHTPTDGGIGALAMGAGGIDVAVAMGGGPFYLTAPKVIKIHLEGALPPWVAAKDVILKVLECYSTKGNVGCIFEYGGPGVASLDVPERATITNMGAECGVTTSLFPSDERTKQFMEAQNRGADWVELKADDDAEYDEVFTIDLSTLEPLTAAPHSPGNIKTIVDVAGLKVNQVLIGSCTNSSLRDLKTVAAILRGKTVNPNVTLGVAHGSRQVMRMLAKDGDLADIIGAGARLLENACGFCIGNSMSPGSGDVSLRTSNRNFEGRSGTIDAQVYLVSPEVAAAAALAGEVVDPRKLGATAIEITVPERYDIDDSMFVFPESITDAPEIERGPNIGAPPIADPLGETLGGVATIKVGDNITTDHIMPAGARLKYRSNVPAYSEFVFEMTDPEFATRAAAARDQGLHNVILAGQSYGQGSSREHAALCPMYLGVRAVIAQSIERIHMANLINFGIVPMLFADAADYEKVAQGDALSVPNLREAIAAGSPVVVRNETQGLDIPVQTDFTDRQRQILLAGGLLNYTREEG